MVLKNLPDDQNPGPEPKPDWQIVQKKLGWLWPGHVYFFAIVFVLLGVAASFALFLARRSLQERRIISIVMLAAVFFLGVSRSAMLFTDPYLSSENSSPWWNFFCILITGCGTTCLSASLAILLYITAVSTQITRPHEQVHLRRLICIITICNFVFFVTSDLVVTFSQEAKVMLSICQITFAVWGLIVSLGFALLTFKLRGNSQASLEQARFNMNMRREGDKLRRLGILLAILSLTAALFFALRINEALSGMKVTEYSDPWSWWSLKTALRFLEVISAVVLLLVFKGRLRAATSRDEETARAINIARITMKQVKPVTPE